MDTVDADVGSEGLVVMRLDRDDLGWTISVGGEWSPLTCPTTLACVCQALAGGNRITARQLSHSASDFQQETGKDFKTETHLLWPRELIGSSPGQDSIRSFGALKL